jgi:hypothetical protein
MGRAGGRLFDCALSRAGVGAQIGSAQALAITEVSPTSAASSTC